MPTKSKQNLLKLINLELDINPPLTFDDVDLSQPEVADGGGIKTRVTVTSKLRNDDSEPEFIFYKRRPLSDYIPKGTKLGADDPITQYTAHDLLEGINELFDLRLLPDDIEDTPITGETFVLSAKGDSHEWCNSVELKIVPNTALADLVKTTKLDGFNYPDTDDTNVGQASFYSYDVNCTAIRGFLGILMVGVAIDDNALAGELNRVVDEYWVAQDEPAPFNLRGSKVIYDGPTPATGYFNRKYSRVVSIQLGPLCTAFQGVLNLHYHF